ncbi:tetratricopeptide repeat protein [Halocatena salina]|uniref:Tetratricopeptide repeat protein n=1 Tax=Halocatena salina TaxID=2934340 RepID=A0A8U0A3R5_9EURY|nr:tetratricopeptide repeat protein [Halocatena salina]UPM43088.1 tetratricopeptide repeat protein [Halocatena salina]
MVDRLEWSRSTVDRAVRELQQAGLLKRSKEGYTTTLAGRLAAATYTEFTEMVSDVHTATPLLETLDREYPVPMASLWGIEPVPIDDHTPYEIPTELREAIEDAHSLTALMPVISDPIILEFCQSQAVEGSLDLTLIVGPNLYDALHERSPDTLSVLSHHGQRFLRAAHSPPHPMFLLEGSSGREGFVIVYEEGAHSAMFRNRRQGAFEAAQEYVDSIIEQATEITDTGETMKRQTPMMGPQQRSQPGRTDSHPLSVLEREGFIELTDAYIESHEPGEPTTSWRTGIDFAEIAVGHAIERTYDGDRSPSTETDSQASSTGVEEPTSGRASLVGTLLDGLSSGNDHALVGLPGSGKSTVCKMVAYRWHETDRGDVLYREGGAGRTFTSTAALRARLRECEGHALIVIEDVLSPEAKAVFRVMADYRDDPAVTFLVESREHAWADPSASSSGLAPRLDSYRTESIDCVRMPALDIIECERLIRHFEAMQGRQLAIEVSDLLDSPEQSSDPATLLVVLHRLVLSVDPLASVRDTTPTTLTEDVRRTFDDLRAVGDRALDVGVLVSLLNAADIGVHPELVYALTSETTEAIEEALALLEGRVIFDRSDSDDENENNGMPSYRSVHKSWSVLFLRQLHERVTSVDEMRAAQRRFGRVVTALLSLADDQTKRACIDWQSTGTSTVIKEISADPQAWADETTERLFTLGLTHSSLVPLFETSANSWIELPEACSDEMEIRCTEWCGRMALQAGAPDQAATEFEHLAALADDPPASVDADCLEARCLKYQGTVAFRRSEYDRAESFYNRSRRAYRAAGDEQGEADVVNNLGIVAWSRGELAAAKERLQWSLDRYQKLGDHVAAADARFNRAMVLNVEGDTETATEQYQVCLDRYRSAGNSRSEANALNNLGVLKRECGELDTAERHLTRAFDTYRDVGDELGQAGSLHGLGYVAQIRGNFERAVEYYERSLDRYRDASDTHGVARCLHDHATLDRRRGRLDAAKQRYERSYDLRVDIGDQRGIAECLISLGRIALRTGAIETALDRVKCGLDRYRQHGDVRGEATALELLGALYRNTGRTERAKDSLDRSLERTRESNHRLGEARTLRELGRLAEVHDDLERAKEHHESALSTFSDIGARPDVVETCHELVAICEALDEPETAATHRNTAIEFECVIGTDHDTLNRRTDGRTTSQPPPSTDGTTNS